MSRKFHCDDCDEIINFIRVDTDGEDLHVRCLIARYSDSTRTFVLDPNPIPTELLAEIEFGKEE